MRTVGLVEKTSKKTAAAKPKSGTAAKGGGKNAQD